MDDSELDQIKRDLHDIADGVDRAVGFICGLAAFVAAIPGAQGIDPEQITVHARKLCPDRIARFPTSDPKQFAAEMVHRIARIATELNARGA
jgi:hypothetical protein